MSLAWSAYRVIAPLLGVAAPAARAFAPASERSLWAERLGHVRAQGGPREGPPEGRVDAWIHAASLGEALAVGPLVSSLASLQPAARFHLTASTRGGRERLGALGWPHTLAPIDAPQAITRFMSAVRPRRLFLIETELWPHWLLAARERGVEVAVVSARLSAGSVAGYLRLGSAFRALIAALGAVLAQSAADAERWRSLGAPAARTEVVGNLKDDALPEPAADRSRARADLGLDPGRPLLVLGSLRPGEARQAAAAWRAIPPALRERWQVAAVPRHPYAAAALRREAEAEGQALVGDGAPAHGAWRWEERLGVLASYYAAAEVALLGGTLGPYGGHNPLEPAACGAAVIVGPHYQSQADAVAALLAAGGARRCEGADELIQALGAWLTDDRARQAAGAAGLAVVAARRGAAARAVRHLAEWSLWPAT